MTGDVDDVLRLADRAAIERKLTELRAQRNKLDEQIRMREEFLAVMDRWRGPRPEPEPSEPVRTVPEAVTPRHDSATSTPRQRREAVLAVLRRDPDREWTTDEIKQGIDAQGVSFEGGTPLKGILFRMTQANAIERPRIGVYKLPATGRDNGHVEQEAPGL